MGVLSWRCDGFHHGLSLETLWRGAGAPKLAWTDSKKRSQKLEIPAHQKLSCLLATDQDWRAAIEQQL
jgi:hypothetical protein